MEIQIEIGQWGGSKREPMTLRNYSEVLKLYAKLNDSAYISAPTRPEPFQYRDADNGKMFVWSYGRHGCWSENVCTDIPTWEKCKTIAKRYNKIVAAIQLDQRRKSDKLTPCPECKRESAVEFSRGPWADYWNCLYCDYKSEYRLGD